MKTKVRPEQEQAARQEHGLLGWIVWYTIGSGAEDRPLPATRKQMQEWYVELGLDPLFLPAEILGADAFRAASTHLTGHYVVAGTEVKLSVVEASRSKEQIVRNLVRTSYDTAGRPMSVRVAKLNYVRPRRTSGARLHGTERITTEINVNLTDDEREIVNATLERFRDQYQLFRYHLGTSAVRSCVRNYLTYIGGVPIEGQGGTYYMSIEHTASLQAIKAMVPRLGPKCYLRMIELLDTEEQRKMVMDSAEAEAEITAARVLRDIDKGLTANAGRPLTRTQWLRYRSDTAALIARYQGFADRFGGLGRAAETVDHLVDAINELPVEGRD